MIVSPFSSRNLATVLTPGMLIAAFILLGCSAPSEEPQLSAGNIGEETDCCSCAISGAAPLTGSDILPCIFDHPSGWTGLAGSDGALVSAVIGPPSCGANCPMGDPGIAFSIGTKADSNADTMEEIWRQTHPIVGDARCGDSTVTFFGPPGADPDELLGGVKFYIGYGGKQYSGHATFTCGTPGGWLELRNLFIDTFRTNPGTTFGA